MSKRLTKGKDIVLFGVCSGFAEYFDIDITLMRIIWCFLCLYGIGFMLYLICAIIIPKN